MDLIEPRAPAKLGDYRTVTLDLDTLTMGELAAAEVASGMTYRQMLRSGMARKILAMFIHELRSSARPRSWNELANLRLVDGSSSTSVSQPDETPAK